MLAPLQVLRQYRGHDRSLHDAFDSRMESGSRADRSFLMQDGTTLSWFQFSQACGRLAGALAARGIGHGTRVAVIGRNHRTHVLALFALARIGAVMVPLNPDFGDRELRHCLALADVSGVIAQAQCADGVAAACDGLPVRPWLATFDEVADWSAPLADSFEPGTAEDTCVLIFTSGTTGFPKAVMHSQSNLVLAGEANVARVHLQPDDRLMIVLPFFHMNALFYSVGGAVAAGACVVVVERFSASAFWDTAADAGATVVNVIEAIGSILCARDRSEYRPDHRLRVAYGVRSKSAATFRRDFGIHQIFSGFGMTEIPGVTCNPFGGPDKPGSMGVVGRHPDPAQPWAACRVVDETGADATTGTPGELWVKAPISMQGYFRDPVQTAAAFCDGWLMTGDLVRQDEDGFFFHLSRLKDIIRKRGENIAAAELEAVVGEHAAVQEVAALALPSELGEDEILIVAVLDPHAAPAPTHADVAGWCRDRLAPIKVPRYVVFIDAMPYTPTHKISKAALRADPQVRQRMVDLQAAA